MLLLQEKGHFESECRKKQFDFNKGGANVFNTEESTSHSMFISCQATNESSSKDVWLLDNGCNNHMTGNKKLFSSLDNSVKFEIKLGGDHLVDALGKAQFLS